LWAAIGLAHLTGFSGQQNNDVAAYMGHVSISGLLLAGFIIGSLGVLNDVTVTQASMVFELAAVGSKTSRRTIFLGAMRVGRDHIARRSVPLTTAIAAVMAVPHERESISVEPPVAIAEREQFVGRGWQPNAPGHLPASPRARR
jgi:uncharacterized membrane protein